MTVTWTIVPAIVDLPDEDEKDEGDHLQCICDTSVSLCGAYVGQESVEYEYDLQWACRDCRMVLQEGWRCALCGRFFQE